MINYGVVGTVHGPVTLAPRPLVAWPHRVGLPPLLADCRQRRRPDLELASITLGSTVVLCGLGGVGKTQLAVAFAEEAWRQQRVDLLVWINATSRDSIVTGYAQTAANITGADDSDPQRGAATFIGWLAEPHGRRWLIVLDDLGDPADLHGLWPPDTGLGQTLVTTRRRDSTMFGHDRQRLDVGLFTAEEGASYLTEKLHGDPDRLTEAGNLVDDLGYLPLALAQAAAYLADRGLDCTIYRQRFADRRRRLFELVPEPGSLPDQHRTTIATTWSLSIDVANELMPQGLARPLLELAAILNPRPRRCSGLRCSVQVEDRTGLELWGERDF
jgi:hypothetical protein